MDERRQFYALLGRKLKITEIAALMSRHKSTLYREIKRNFWHDEEVPKAAGYFPVTAQSFADERRARQCKLIRFPKLLSEVKKWLKTGWSPEQIAGRLKTEPNAPWQKGSVENMNKRARRYLPRTTVVLSVSDQEMKAICDNLNSTPRKCLGYRTPAEVFRDNLQRLQG